MVEQLAPQGWPPVDKYSPATLEPRLLRSSLLLRPQISCLSTFCFSLLSFETESAPAAMNTSLMDATRKIFLPNRKKAYRIQVGGGHKRVKLQKHQEPFGQV
jgi:hypothetical protein